MFEFDVDEMVRKLSPHFEKSTIQDNTVAGVAYYNYPVPLNTLFVVMARQVGWMDHGWMAHKLRRCKTFLLYK